MVADSVKKETNPKDLMGIKKAPLSTLSGPVLFELGNGMLEGAMKYGRHNYRSMGVSASVYFDAAQRHLWAWWEGEDIDPDSGLSHVAKAMTSLLVLRDSMIKGNWKDDRPLHTDQEWMKINTAHAASLVDKYPNPVQPYTEKELN